MLDEEQVALLRAIGSSITFDDDEKGKVTYLVVEGYVLKDGDLYELTPKGMKILEERGYVSVDRNERAPATRPSPVSGVSDRHASWRDVIVELTRTAPFVMLGAAFVAGVIFARRR